MDVDSASEQLKEEVPDQLDENEDELEMQINPSEIIETKHELKNEENNPSENDDEENVPILDPLEMVSVKCEPELCLEDLVSNEPTIFFPSQFIKVKNESDLVSEDALTVALMPSLFSLDENDKSKFTFSFLVI